MNTNSKSGISRPSFSGKFKYFLAAIVACSSFSIGGNSELLAKSNYPKSGVKVEDSQKVNDVAHYPIYLLIKDNHNSRFNSMHFPRVGFHVAKELDMNKGTLYRTKTGQKCLDHSEYSRVHARFISEKTPPAHGRRVMIRNITGGMEMHPYPYTDREYDQGSMSEGLILEKGYGHRNRSLSVLKGKNIFEYKITEMGKVIDSGTFTFTLDLQDHGMNKRSGKSRGDACYANSKVVSETT